MKNQLLLYDIARIMDYILIVQLVQCIMAYVLVRVRIKFLGWDEIFLYREEIYISIHKCTFPYERICRVEFLFVFLIAYFRKSLIDKIFIYFESLDLDILFIDDIDIAFMFFDATNCDFAMIFVNFVSKMTFNA